MLIAHRLPVSDFDALAAGLGSTHAIAALRSAQLSRRLIGLRAVIDAAEQAGHSDAPGFLAALDLLVSAQAQDGAAVAAVLGYPFVGSWVAHCLRGLDARAHDIARDLGHLACIAAAAAIQAGVPFHIEVPVRGGAVYLPTLGRLITSNAPTAVVDGDGREAAISGVPLAVAGPRWQVLRRITSRTDGQSFTVTLDDVDPFRSAGALRLTPRLDTATFRSWEDALQGAWEILVRHHRDYASAIAAGMLSIVPLMATQPNRGINATSRESFGSTAMSMMADSVTFAGALIHEFQHAKLNGLLDLVTLYRPDQARYYAPWREDPRPLGGLLHGAYAFLGICDFWRIQRMTPTTPFPAYAEMEYARWLDRTSCVVDILLSSGSLTAAGERFVHGMRERLASWTEGVTDESAQLALTASVDHRVRWRLRNARPDAAAIGRLTDAWQAGESVPSTGAVAVELIAGGSALGSTPRLDLIHLRLREPGLFARPVELASYGIAVTPPDWHFASGDFAVAAAGYRARIASEPECRDAWAGLALALRDTSDSPAAAALLNGPELVSAVYNRLLKSTGQTPDPEVIAAWLAPIIPPDPLQ